jgi:hypothetical protein
MIVILFGITRCSKKSNPVEPSHADVISTDHEVSAGTATIGLGGGTFTIDLPGTPVDGLQIIVPENAYTDSRTFTISYAPIKNHDLGEYFNPVSPLISIENGGGYSDQPITVKIPISISPDEFAMTYIYDDETGDIEGMPLLNSDTSAVTAYTFTFASGSSGELNKPARYRDGETSHLKFVVSSLPKSILAGPCDSGFKPGTDDWEFPNYGSALEPRGHCAGQSLAAMWYYIEKRQTGSPPLNGLLDNDGNARKTPIIWQDNNRGYKFCSVLQHDAGWATISNVIGLLAQSLPVPINDLTTLLAFKSAIFLTKEPQLVMIKPRNFLGGHAMIAYKIIGNTMYIADPNYPKEERPIQFNGIFFEPYQSGENANLISTGFFQEYSHIYYQGKSKRSMFKWNSIESRWNQVLDGTIGNGLFPEYSIKALNDNVEFVPFEDGFKKQDGSMGLSVTVGGGVGQYELYDQNQKRIYPWNGIFQLPAGKQILGVYVSDRNFKWTGFKWVNLEINSTTPSYTFNACAVGVEVKADYTYSGPDGSNVYNNSFKEGASCTGVFTGNIFNGSFDNTDTTSGFVLHNWGTVTVTLNASLDTVRQFTLNKQGTSMDTTVNSIYQTSTFTLSAKDIPVDTNYRTDSKYFVLSGESIENHITGFNSSTIGPPGYSIVVGNYQIDESSLLSVYFRTQ